MRERARRIRTLGNQAFNVPCNEEGRTFLRLMKKFINRPTWRFSARGRGPRALDGRNSYRYQSSIPQERSEWLAVYMGGTSGWGRSFRSVLNPNEPRHIHHYTTKAVPVPAARLTDAERALVQKVFESAEDDPALADPEVEEVFYSAFEKLVDI